MADEEVQVTYTLREVLADINRKLDSLTVMLAGKADSSRVDELDSRVRAVEAAQEHGRKSRDERAHAREWLIPVLLTAVIVVITVIQFFHH